MSYIACAVFLEKEIKECDRIKYINAIDDEREREKERESHFFASARLVSRHPARVCL